MIVLVLGGTRSGKSEVAEHIASELGAPVTYVATARDDLGDADFAARVAAHRSRRPAAWTTIEEPRDLAGALARIDGTALIESLGTWLANTHDFAVDARALCDALTAHQSVGAVVVVSEEVGLAPLPVDAVARRFVDALGECNRAVAAVADRVVLVVAGRTLELGRG